MELPVNPSQLIDLLRAWFFAKDRSIVLAPDTFAEFPEISIPGNPATNRHRFYYKSTGLYELLSDGTELAISENLKNWTPAITQPGAVAATINEAKWKYSRDLIFITAKLTVTGTGSAGSAISITGRPVAPSLSGTAVTFGSATIFDSGTTFYSCSPAFVNSTLIQFLGWSAGAGAIGALPSFALASGDIISFTGWYRWR